MPHYTDIDNGQFLKKFQTTEFNQRLWELYLFCYFNEELFSRDTTHNRPDFVLEKHGQKIGVEAVTIGSVSNESNIPNLENTEAFCQFMRFRFARKLKEKLSKEYWKEPIITDSPLLIAIADFSFEAAYKPETKSFRPASMSASSSALEQYLYGYTWTYEFDRNGHVKPLYTQIIDEQNPDKLYGFFNLEDAKHISAVISTSVGTIAKFNRMGKLAGFGSDNVRRLHEAKIYNPDPRADKPIIEVAEVINGKYEELWSTGLNIYHNPNAYHPIPFEFFPSAMHSFWRDGNIVAEMDWGLKHIFNSMTHIVCASDSGYEKLSL